MRAYVQMAGIDMDGKGGRNNDTMELEIEQEQSKKKVMRQSSRHQKWIPMFSVPFRPRHIFLHVSLVARVLG